MHVCVDRKSFISLTVPPPPYLVLVVAAEGGSLWAEFRAMCRAGLDEETATTRPCKTPVTPTTPTDGTVPQLSASGSD